MKQLTLAMVAVVALGTARAAPALPQQPAGDPFAKAVLTFYADSVEASVPLFAAAARLSPGDAARHAFLAEAARRTGRWDLAVTEARRALQLAPCLAFAHTVLSSLYNPQYSDYQPANADSSLGHAMEAVRCDPREGASWMALWIHGLEAPDTALERRALTALVRERFITPPYQSHGRWVLESAPPRTILVANGDMDTYPPVAQQVVNGLRPDVVVVNRALLNLPWYAARLHDRYGVPLPPMDKPDTTLTPGDYILAFWARRAAANGLGRPLAILQTVGQPPVGRLAGPFWVVDSAAAAGAGADRERVAAALRAADSLDWVGPAVAEMDRSPVRRASVQHPALYVAYLGMLDIDAGIKAADTTGARARLRWLERFLASAAIPQTEIDAYLADLRAWFAQVPER